MKIFNRKREVVGEIVYNSIKGKHERINLLDNSNLNIAISKGGPKLTIGMATHDDYDGVYFTIQSIRLYHAEILDKIRFLIVDNNPDSEHGKQLRKFSKSVQNLDYYEFRDFKSTVVKNEVFKLSKTPYVLCIDCHVMIQPNSIKKLIEFFDKGKDKGNLLQGPLLYDDMKSISTHFDLKWRDRIWGTWQTDERGKDINGYPFEIPSQGMGLFACRKTSWLGFNPNFRGFGGEEGYIHEKYRKHGKKTLCLPFLRWIHRFGRPNGITYPNKLEDRIKNYFIGFKELGLNTYEIHEHFEQFVSKQILEKYDKETNKKEVIVIRETELQNPELLPVINKRSAASTQLDFSNHPELKAKMEEEMAKLGEGCSGCKLAGIRSKYKTLLEKAKIENLKN